MKEKIKKLNKYIGDLKSRLNSPTPSKWAHAPEAYKAFLKREIDLHFNKVTELQMQDTKDAK